MAAGAECSTATYVYGHHRLGRLRLLLYDRWIRLRILDMDDSKYKPFLVQAFKTQDVFIGENVRIILA